MLALIGSAVLQPDGLHPIFVRDEKKYIAAYERGRSDAKRKMREEKLIRMWSKDLGKVRSPEGHSWTTSYLVFTPPYMSAHYQGWTDQREYRDDAEFKADVKDWATADPEERRITFGARLFAWPGVSDWDHSINRSANRRDVEDVRFVILVDGKRAIHPEVRPTPESVASYDGSVSIPQSRTIHGSSTTDSSATATGPGGTVTATGTSTTTSSVTYYTHRRERYSYHIADYELMFPMYDKEGKPYVTERTKKLEMKVIRRNGEMGTSFNLDDYKAFYK